MPQAPDHKTNTTVPRISTLLGPLNINKSMYSSMHLAAGEKASEARSCRGNGFPPRPLQHWSCSSLKKCCNKCSQGPWVSVWTSTAGKLCGLRSHREAFLLLTPSARKNSPFASIALPTSMSWHSEAASLNPNIFSHALTRIPLPNCITSTSTPTHITNSSARHKLAQMNRSHQCTFSHRQITQVATKK